MIRYEVKTIPMVLQEFLLKLPTSLVESKYGTTKAIPYSRNEDYFNPILRIMFPDQDVRDRIHDCRIITLEPNKEIKPHTDSKKGPCYHLVLKTNEGCSNTWGNETYHMEQGYVYEVDQGLTHSAINNGDTDRSHLMVILKEIK